MASNDIVDTGEGKGCDCLQPFCTTARQREILRTYIEAGENAVKAAKVLKSSHSYVSRTIRILKERAATKGVAPGHFNNGVAPGFAMGKVTVQRGPNGVERVWERQSPDKVAAQEAILDAISDAADGIPKIKLPEPKETVEADLCTLYPLADLHMGMLAWAKEGGDPWDIEIAPDVMVNAVHDLAEGSPASEHAIICLLGDFVHWDGATAVTPTSHHLLDSDIRFQKLQKVSLEVLEKSVEILCKKHKQVHIIQNEGNHDIASASWLRVVMNRLFRDEPRVTVDDMPCPYSAYLHGEIFLGFHHGHRKRGKALAGVFAGEPRFREMWGKAKYSYLHTGHMHSSERVLDEGGGAIVERHPTLAARDAYATGLGCCSLRSAHAITYHKTMGETQRVTVLPRYEDLRSN